MVTHHLDQTAARRIAIRAQLLDARPSTDLLGIVRQLSMVQIDPTAAIAPNADLVLWTRMGLDRLDQRWVGRSTFRWVRSR